MTIKFWRLGTTWISDNWLSKPENVWEMNGKNWKVIEVTLKNSRICVTMEASMKMGLIPGRLVESLFKKEAVIGPNPSSHAV